MAERLRRQGWIWALAGGAALIVVRYLVPTQLDADVVYSVIGIASVVLILVGVRIQRPDDPAAWYLVAAAGALFALGDLIGDWYSDILHVDTPVPSVADVAYLCAYPFLFLGVIRLCRDPERRSIREDAADAGVIALACLAVSWHFLLDPYAHQAGVTTAARIVALAYPVMDVALAFVLFRSVIFGARRRPFHWLLIAAMTTMFVADFLFDLLTLHGSYPIALDLVFLAEYVFIAVAALHPSAAGSGPPRQADHAGTARPDDGVAPRWRVGDPHPVDRRRVDGTRRLPLIALAAFVPPALLVVTAVVGGRTDVAAVAVLCLATFALLCLRMLWMLRRLGHQSEELERHTRALEASHRERDTLEAELRHLAYHDELTGLANRTLLLDRLAEALGQSDAGGTVAVCYCDLDGFKEINDTLGHHVGDTVLQRAAAVLDATVREDDTVARMGGDEFAVLMPGVGGVGPAVEVARRLVTAIDEALGGSGGTGISMSVGVAVADGTVDPEGLVGEADAAMYEAKAAGRHRVTVFEPAMRSRILERNEVANGFRGALDRGEFALHYQPIVDLPTGELCGFEALARWEHPILGQVPPGVFVPVAEETGFIAELGRWALREATAQMARWTATFGGDLRIAVNLSRRQLTSPDLTGTVREALTASGLPPRQLILEITENVLLDDPERATVALAELRGMGIAISVDDFGTGYSSLSYLQRFPVDVLKIDQSFVAPLNRTEPASSALVSTIIRLARAMELDVVAEGIERRDQLERLVELGCAKGQGYLVSRPLDAGGATAALARRALEPAGRNVSADAAT